MARPTISDVARRAGVSKTAVSFAFNNPSRLATETVERIRTTAEELGYSPDPVARSMSTKRTGTIGLLVPQTLPEMARNPFFAKFLEGLAEVTTEAELPVLLVPPLRGSMERAVNGAAVDGFITLGLETFRPTMHVLERRGLPYVMVDSDPTQAIACINVDDAEGAYQAMHHVLERGHRRVAILGIRSPRRGQWEKYVGTLRRRMEGYVRALGEFGLEMGSEVRLTECEVSEQGGRTGLGRVWRRRPRPSALVAMSDIIALGAMQEAQGMGISMPEELSVVGFDDIPEAQWARPRLTTVRQPAREKGRIAAGLLVELLGGAKRTDHLVLGTALVVRDSVAKPALA